MMRINPNAVVFWIICGGVGYLVNDLRGLITGIVVAMAISLIADIGDSLRRRK